LHGLITIGKKGVEGQIARIFESGRSMKNCQGEKAEKNG